MQESESLVAQLWGDLRRRKVVRVAAAYAVVAWVLVEVSSVVLPALLLPEWTVRLVVIVTLAGFPLTLLLAWLFDVTGGRIVLTAPSDAASRMSVWSARTIFLVVFGATIVAVVALWPAEQAASHAPPNSIAVLPFDNFSELEKDDYFSDGISEELLNSLVGVEGLQVAARTSSFAFRDRAVGVRQIGEELNVAKVLEGSVRRQGNRVRITAQLINVEDGYHIWSRTFERPLDDIFAVQAEISGAIVEQLKLTLIGDQPRKVSTANIQAYDLYLLGRYHWHQRTEESLRRSLELFRQAVEIDADFALAYTGIADAYLLLENYGHLQGEEGFDEAEPAIARALALKPDLPEAYASLGLLRLNRSELTAAELALRKAVQLNDNFSMAHMWLGLVLRNNDTLYAASEEFARARELDPLHPVVNYNAASTLAAMGDYAAARDLLRGLIARLTEEPQRTHLALAEVATMFGRYDEAIDAAMQALKIDPENLEAAAALARAYANLGDFDRAAGWAERLASPRGNPLQLMVLSYIDYLRGDNAALYARFDDADVPAGSKQELLARLWTGIAMVSDGDYANGAVALEAVLSAGHAKEMMVGERLLLRPVLASAYRQLGNEARAVELFEQTLSLADAARASGWATPDLTAVIAAAQSGLGRFDEAAATLQQAVDEGWRDYWFAIRLPILPPTDAASARLHGVLGDVRGELEQMRRRVLEAEEARSA